ncbi:MAG: hypothetical protein CM15mV11_3240 [Caudoviricetes sp.]|nr:MAG: hypothetical protein CM15mV11_3240 [Caudoviricetes sp.]
MWGDRIPMKLKSYLVESINFDFEDSQGTIPEEDQRDIILNTLGVWFAYDEDHLLDKISDTMGWCITDIEYGDNRPHKLTAFK